MDTQMIYEIIGYIASVITALSLTMKNIRRLRWWNLFGSATFSVYGGLIGAWPVFALNGFVAIVNIYYLISMNRHKEYFDLMEVDIHHSDFARRYLDYYKDDIQIFFPDFKPDPKKDYKSCFCLRDARPVGLIVFSELDKDKMLVELDYAIPEYRDMKNGKYLYLEGIKKLGLGNDKQFISKNINASHQRYLKALGFVQVGVENDTPVFMK